MNVKEQIKRELQVDFELNEEKTHVVFYETLDYHFKTELTRAQMGELIEVLAKLRNQMR